MRWFAKTGTRQDSRFRNRVAFDRLEDRRMLSVVPPTITEVSVAGSAWTASFSDHLETSGLGTANELADGSEILPTGYAIPLGTSDQLNPLSWDGIDQIQIRFSEDVSVDVADLSVSGVSVGQYAFSDFDYYPEIGLAVWTLASPIGTDRVHLDLDADGVDPVVDRDGNLLDGDWTDSLSTVSGNGSAGGDFEFRFNVLPGDVLGQDLLDYNNLYHIYYREGSDTSHSAYLAKADVDGDGLIESSDRETVSNNMYASTPSGTPVGITNDSPTTSGLGVTEISDDTVDVALSLYNAFEDAEDTDQQLTYTLKNVSDPTLFDSVTINNQTGQLVLNTAAAVNGWAYVTVEATDQSGLSVEAIAKVGVDKQNVGPTISVTTTDGGSGQWLIEGWVTDLDSTPNELDQMEVLLTGMFTQLVSVAETGYFYFVVLLDPTEGGYLFATVDDGVEESDPFYVEIGWGS